MCEFYTDGSADINHVGSWAIYCPTFNIRICGRIYENTTNNVMELTAVLHTLLLSQKILEYIDRIHIYTDSQYVIGVLTKDWDIKCNIELILQIKELMSNIEKPIDFYWVKGHSDNLYNKIVDALANVNNYGRN